MSFSSRRVVVNGNSQQQQNEEGTSSSSSNNNNNIHVLLNKMNMDGATTHSPLQVGAGRVGLYHVMEQQIEEHIESLKVYVGMCNNHAITLSTAVAVAAREQEQAEASVEQVTMVLMMDMFRHCFGALKDAVEYSKRKKQQKEFFHQLLLSSSPYHPHLSSSSSSKRTTNADEVIFLKNQLMDGLMDCHAACQHGKAVMNDEVNVMVGEAIRLALIVLDEQDDEELVTQFETNYLSNDEKEQKFYVFPCDEEDDKNNSKIHKMTLPQMFQLTIQNMYYCLQQASSSTTSMDKHDIKKVEQTIDGSMDMD